MRQSWPLNQSGEILGMLNLEVAAKRLLPHGYGEGYCMAVLDQLKAWGGGVPCTRRRLKRKPSHAFWGHPPR